MRYVVGHFLHVFTYILLTRVQLFIDKPRPFAQIEIDAGAHAQIFTTEGIPSGTEALSIVHYVVYLTLYDVWHTLQYVVFSAV